MKNRKGYKKGGSNRIKMPEAPILTISDKGKGTAGPRPGAGWPRPGMGRPMKPRPGAGWPRPGMGRPAVRPSKPATGGIKPLKASGPRPGMGRPIKPRPGAGGPRAEMSRPMKRRGRAEGGMVDFGSIFEMEKKSGK